MSTVVDKFIAFANKKHLKKC